MVGAIGPLAAHPDRAGGCGELIGADLALYRVVQVQRSAVVAVVELSGDGTVGCLVDGVVALVRVVVVMVVVGV